MRIVEAAPVPCVHPPVPQDLLGDRCRILAEEARDVFKRDPGIKGRLNV